ncbi:hypothetical protein, partial [Streptomyces sp. NPDC089919]|uniref:hypothetical protein n=1 Tax=Streptomyces sp. NPDC089919 TaxID=3155188 RepID=UPI0034364928
MARLASAGGLTAVDARDVAQAAVTRAATPFMAKAGCVGAVLAVVGMIGLGSVTLLAGAARQASDGKNGAAGCATPGLPGPAALTTVPAEVLAQQTYHAKVIDQVAGGRGGARPPAGGGRRSGRQR